MLTDGQAASGGDGAGLHQVLASARAALEGGEKGRRAWALDNAPV